MRFEAIVIASTLIFVGHVQGRLDVPTPATQGVLANTPGLRGVQHGERLCALFGAPIATHNNPATTDAFVDAHFAVQANRNALGVDGLILSDTFTRKITANGNAFTVYTYDQWLPNDGTQVALPVYGMKVKVVVHHDAVEAMGYVGMRLVPNPEVPLPIDVLTDTAALGVVQALPSYSGLTAWSTPTKIAYQTDDGALHRTWHFRGSNQEEAFLFFVDTHSEELLDAIDLVLHFDVDVSGTVQGYTTPCCLPGQPDWPACCPSGLPDCCCEETDPSYPECTYLCCAVDNPDSNDPNRYPVEMPMGGILVEARTVPSGVLLQDVYAEPDGSYLLTGLPSGNLEIRTKLEGRYVLVESSFGSGQPDLVESDIVNGSQTDVDFTFNTASGFPTWPETLRTAQVNAFLAVEKTREWFVNLQPNYPGMDQQIICEVNRTGEGVGFGARYGGGKILAFAPNDPDSPLALNNPSSKVVISHEYGHFIMEQTIDLAGDDDFQEGVADAIASLMHDTECMAADHQAIDFPYHVHPCLRNVDRPADGFQDFVNCGVNDCEVKMGDDRCDTAAGPSSHCKGLALAGAFWDLRKMIGDTDTEMLFSKFLLVTDGYMDESVLSEILIADDDNGMLSDGTDHCAEILCAFVGNNTPCTVGGCSTLPTCAETGHGWACPTASTGLLVGWNHPTIPNPSPITDYALYDQVYPPSVVLKNTTPGVTQWDVGRTVDGLPADIGVVTADWDPMTGPLNISVFVGAQSGMPCRNVGVVDIPAQSTATYSNVKFDLSGDLIGRARVFPNTTNQQGGRVEGSIAGTARRIVAQDVGSGPTDGGILDVRTLGTFSLGNLASTSQLTADILSARARSVINGLLEGDVVIRYLLDSNGGIEVKGSGVSTGSILVDGDIRGGIHFNGSMAGEIIADADGNGTGAIKLHGLNTFIVVQGLFTGNICGANVSADRPLPPFVYLTFGAGGKICDSTVLRNKNRYLTFQPFSGSNSVAYSVDKVTSPTGTCWVAVPESGFGTAQCVDSPVYRVWNESFVHVGDCEIVPVADYEIRSTSDGVAFSAPISLQTIEEPSLNGKLWGDVVGANNGTQWTEPNLFTNVQDVQAILSYINGAAIKPLFTAANLQAISSPDSCLNCFVNTADVLIVVGAVAGNSYGPPSTAKIVDPAQCPECPDLDCTGMPESGGEGENFSGGGEGFFGPESFSSTATFDLNVTPYQIDAEETATLSVYLDAAEVIGGYEASLDVTGGTTGTLTRETITINTNHNNFLFAGHGTYLATNVESNMAGAVEASGTGVLASSDEYLATYTFLASSDAEGVFEVRVSDGRSFILDEEGNQVAHDASVVGYVRVGVECTSAAHCDDGNQCTSDACTSGVCVNTNLTSGTACDDGLYCTLTDTCNGSGVCVGSAAKPCSKPNPVCCEATDSCHPSGHECELES